MPSFRPPASLPVLEEAKTASAVRRISLLHGRCFEVVWTPDSILSLITRSATWALIAKTPQEDAGFILISKAADQAEILSIGVKPALRRAGIASILLRSSIARLEHSPVKYLFLDVARSSQPARAL